MQLHAHLACQCQLWYLNVNEKQKFTRVSKNRTQHWLVQHIRQTLGLHSGTREIQNRAPNSHIVSLKRFWTNEIIWWTKRERKLRRFNWINLHNLRSWALKCVERTEFMRIWNKRINNVINSLFSRTVYRPLFGEIEFDKFLNWKLQIPECTHFQHHRYSIFEEPEKKTNWLKQSVKQSKRTNAIRLWQPWTAMFTSEYFRIDWKLQAELKFDVESFK